MYFYPVFENIYQKLPQCWGIVNENKSPFVRISDASSREEIKVTPVVKTRNLKKQDRIKGWKRVSVSDNKPGLEFDNSGFGEAADGYKNQSKWLNWRSNPNQFHSRWDRSVRVWHYATNAQ